MPSHRTLLAFLLALLCQSMATASATTNVTLTSPDGGEAWSGSHNITWSFEGTSTLGFNLTLIDYTDESNPLEYGINSTGPGSTSYPWDTAGYPDGERFRINVSDLDSSTSDLSGYFTLDNTPPSGSISGIDGDWVPSETVTASCNDAGGSGCKPIMRYYTTPGIVSTCSTSRGSYGRNTTGTIEVTASSIAYICLLVEDNAGNPDYTRSSRRLMVDSEVPETSDNAPSGWRGSDVTVTLSCSDSGGSFCNNIHYSTDGSAPSTVLPAWPGRPFTFTAEGTHQLKYYSDDYAGNKEAVKTATVRIDKSGPAITGAAATGVVPSGGLAGMGATITDSLSGVNTASAEAHVQNPDGNDLATVSLLGTGSGTYNGSWDTSGRPAGIYFVDLYAEDNAGNGRRLDNIGMIVLFSPDDVLGHDLGRGVYTTNKSAEATLTPSDSNVAIELHTTSEVSDTSIGVAEYSSNPTNSSHAVASLGRYLEIEVSRDISDNLGWAILRIYYTDDEISGFNENALRIGYYNETSGAWAIHDQPGGVNATDNYVWANISHFSIFGVFGTQWYCGDGYCNNGERCSTCEADCGECPGGGGFCWPRWDCTEWGPCQPNGTQARACIDLNRCSAPWLNWFSWLRPGETRGCRYTGEPAPGPAAGPAPACQEDWSCSEWSSCIRGSMIRVCIDKNACGTDENRPPETQACKAAPPGGEGGPPTGLFLDPAATIYTAVLSILAVCAIALFWSHARSTKKAGPPRT